MKRATMTAPGQIQIDETAAPTPGPGQVLLRIQRIGVCGSDIHVFHGKHPYTSYPVVQGHEFSALVEAVGPGVQGIEVGNKVTAMPQIVCGKCGPCLRGDEHICDALRVQGFQAPGCAQELWVTAADKIVKLPDHFSFEQGALVEPISVAVHAIARAGKLTGRRAVVLGAGPIGNLVAQAARAAGARVLITDLSEHRLEIARRCGLSETSNPAREDLKTAAQRVFGPEGFDLAFECVGVEATLDAAVSNLAKGGTLIVVGVFGDKPRVDLGLVQDRELRISGTLMYQRPDYEQAVAWIDSGDIVTEPLMSEHFAFGDYLQAYRYIDQKRDQTMKVFIDVA
ncbi:MAG TPA: zinc-binding dehydrogenase [Polyangiaceae bacterium]|nr:zinc-binding dehydrogenase [Polyangiaceae bacterium]